jgi:hypothetical protein
LRKNGYELYSPYGNSYLTGIRDIRTGEVIQKDSPVWAKAFDRSSGSHWYITKDVETHIKISQARHNQMVEDFGKAMFMAVRDIEALQGTKDPQDRIRNEMQAFARIFMSRIHAKIRTFEDADAIADKYIAEVENDPTTFIKVPGKGDFNAKHMLRMPDGTEFDPNNIEHALEASNETLLVYEYQKEDTDTNSSRLRDILDREAQEIAKKRIEDLSKIINSFLIIF